jgi:NADH dehydrogenase
MKDKLVTVFGGGGFVGRYVAQALLAAGARVRIAERDPRRAFFLKPLGGLGQTQFLAADVRRPETVARAVAGADVVVNLVGSFADMHALHVGGASTVAKAAAEAGVGALVHISAIGADPEGAARYARTKGEGEAAVRAAFPGATILRPSLMFGQEDQFTNRFAAMIAKAPVVPVLRGATRFQPVYVKDVADAIVKAIADPRRYGGHTYELGGPDVLTMREINGWLADEIGCRRPIVDVPDAIGGAIASLGFLPGAPITADQWKMLQTDNVVAGGAEGLAAFGIVATPMASVAPAWLVRYRRHGRFAKRQQA